MFAARALYNENYRRRPEVRAPGFQPAGVCRPGKRRIYMKKVLSVFLAALLAVSLAACSAPSSAAPSASKTPDAASAAAQPVTITISNWLEAEDATAAIFKELLNDFMAKNPDIKVESQAIPFNQYKDQVLIAGTSGNAADVIMGNSTMMCAFNGANILADLDGLASKEVIDDIYPGYLSGTTYDGKIRALSWAPHPIAMYYNKELFAKAGLDPEKAPATWDEMTAAAKAIAALGKDDAGNTLYGLGLPTGKVAHTGTVLNGILYSFGGQFVDKSGKVVINSDANVEALTYIKDMADAKVIPAGLEIKDLRGLFAAGQIGIIFDGDMGRNAFRSSSGLGNEFDKKMGVATIPVGKTGRSETVYTEHQLGVFAQSKNKEAAIKLVEYLISKDAMLKYHASNAVLSARKSIAALPEMNEDAFMAVFNKQSETASPLPATNALFDNAMNEMTKAEERIVVNGEDVKTVLAETEKTIQTMYGQ